MTDVSSNDSGGKLTVQPGCTHVPPGSKHPCMVYGCPGPAPTTMSAAVAGITRIGELEDERDTLHAQLTKTQEQNWILIARCDELARELSHRICPSCSAQSLGNRGESCPVDGCDGIIIRTTAEGAQAIAATWERAKRAEAERDERFASVVHDCCVNLVEVRAERDDVIRELADALRELTDHLELGTSPLPETARFSRADLARVDAMTGGES